MKILYQWSTLYFLPCGEEYTYIYRYRRGALSLELQSDYMALTISFIWRMTIREIYFRGVYILLPRFFHLLIILEAKRNCRRRKIRWNENSIVTTPLLHFLPGQCDSLAWRQRHRGNCYSSLFPETLFSHYDRMLRGFDFRSTFKSFYLSQ